jgi:alanine dehydrogenase
MPSNKTLLLTRSQVAALLTIEECIAAVERVFKLYGEGKTMPPGILGVHSRGGGFHIKAGLLQLDRAYFAAKVNANFPQNMQRFGLPTIQGVIVLSDAENGFPLALMDSMEITIQRTGAATAVAAKYLANAESKTATICGSGNQGRISLKALATVFHLKKIFLYDSDHSRALQTAAELASPSVDVQATSELEKALSQSEICVTCTPSQHPFLKQDFIRPGTFIAAVGADSEEKQELEPVLLAGNKVVVDILEQCASIGELHHALAEGLMEKDAVHAEIGEVVAGVKPGRVSADEIIIFDSTGMALQDVVVAAAVYEKANRDGVGTLISLDE